MKLLTLHDAVTTQSGFARVAQNLLRQWRPRFQEIHSWSIMYDGMPHRHPYQLYPAGHGEWSSAHNLQKFLSLVLTGGFTHVWIMQDTFQLSAYNFPSMLRKACDMKGVRLLYYFPVDAALEPEWTSIIRAADVPVAYTEYGKEEALRAMPPGEALEMRARIQVLPHGCDTAIYHPSPRREGLRAQTFHEGVGPEDYLLLAVSANQRRKDTPRLLQLLAALRRRDRLPHPVKLCLHMPNESSDGIVLTQVAAQLGLVLNRDYVITDNYFKLGHALCDEAQLAVLYQCADLLVSTTLGEGWGLPITEALACGCPVAVPSHTSCREIAERFTQGGMGSQVCLLPTEADARVLPGDNSRLRPAVAVEAAAEQVEACLLARDRQSRPPLNPELAGWLSWKRIGREWLRFFTAPQEVGKL